MSQSLAKILVHTVFSTKDRRPFLRDRGLQSELHRYIGGILNNLKCDPILVGGVEDHVHILSMLSRTCEPAEMVKEIKTEFVDLDQDSRSSFGELCLARGRKCPNNC